MTKTFKTGEIYRDKGSSTKKPGDEFIRRFKASDGKAIPNAGGIRFRQAHCRDLRLGKRKVASYFVLISNPKSEFDVPWIDEVNENDLTKIVYYGDSKPPANGPYENKGNSALKDAFKLQKLFPEATWLVPPMLHFSKPSPGLVRFNGLYVASSVEEIEMENNGQRFHNLKLNLTRQAVEEIDPKWLNSRATENDLVTADRLAPKGTIWHR